MAVAEHKNQLVSVTEGLTNEETGATETRTLEIPSGATKVPELKTELGIAATDALWVVEKGGKKKALADHESHNVKEGDHFEALVKGGVS
jgi:hypothetical protein